MKRQSHKNRETYVDSDTNDNNKDDNFDNDDDDDDDDDSNRRRPMPKSTSGEIGATEIRSTETETEKSRDIKNCGTSQEIFLSVFLQRSFQDV